MKTEYISRIKLIAEEGMVLTNGTNYGKIIFLSDTESSYNYHEIPESESERIMAEQEKANEII